VLVARIGLNNLLMVAVALVVSNLWLVVAVGDYCNPSPGVVEVAQVSSNLSQALAPFLVVVQVLVLSVGDPLGSKGSKMMVVAEVVEHWLDTVGKCKFGLEPVLVLGLQSGSKFGLWLVPAVVVPEGNIVVDSSSSLEVAVAVPGLRILAVDIPSLVAVTGVLELRTFVDNPLLVVAGPELELHILMDNLSLVVAVASVVRSL